MSEAETANKMGNAQKEIIMTTFIHNNQVLSAEKASEIMNKMIEAGTFSPDNYRGACVAFLEVTTPPPAPVAEVPVKKARKARAADAAPIGWPAGVTRSEYSTWKDSLTADYTGAINPRTYKELRDSGNLPAIAGVSANSNEALNPPPPPSAGEIQGAKEAENTGGDQDQDLEAIVKQEEEKHEKETALAGVNKTTTAKNKSGKK